MKNKMTNKSKGITHIVAAAFFFSLMSFFVRLSGDIPSMQKSFFRNVVALIVATIILLRTEEKFHIGKGNIPLLLIRSTCGTVGLIANFYAIDHMNIADANMLNKLSPFFAVFFSVILLKERTNKATWLAIVAAFIGALFVMKPTFGLSGLPAFVGAIGGLGAGIAYTFVRMLGKRGERGPLIVFFFSAFSTFVCVPYIIFDYHPMILQQWILLICAGCAAMGGQLNITAAYTYAPASEISVFDYSQILFAALLGFVFLGQIPDYLSIIGYVLIIGAAIFKWAKRNST